MCTHSFILGEAGQLGFLEEEFLWVSWGSCLAPPSPSCLQTSRRTSLLFVFPSLPVPYYISLFGNQAPAVCLGAVLGAVLGLGQVWTLLLSDLLPGCWVAARHQWTPVRL